MALTRKKYLVDKKFQLNTSFRAILLPLLTSLLLSGVLLYFQGRTHALISKNNSTIETVISNQDRMIELFLTTPALQDVENPAIQTGVRTFKKNIGELKSITENSRKITGNSRLLFLFLVIMIIAQTFIIFALFIFYTHRMSGPLHVMRGHLRNIREGRDPGFRPLRKGDHLKDFYGEFQETLEMLTNRKE